MTVKGLTLTKKSAFLGRKHDSERVNTDKKIGISGAQRGLDYPAGLIAFKVIDSFFYFQGA